MGRRATRDRQGTEGAPPALPQVYEGPDTLEQLLARAGAPQRASEVVERFEQAQAQGEPRGAVIGALFAIEPRFASPEEAKRLYGNLLALWDELAAGRAPAAPAPSAPAPRAASAPAPQLPQRGAVSGRELPETVVGAAWRHLDALAPRERKRLEDRFESAQPDLVAWLDAQPLGDAGTVAARDLAFECWAMFDVAFGERVERVEWKDLREREREPAPLETTQPALAAYVTEVLELAADEDPSFSAGARAGVERALATVAAVLAEALEPDDEI